jgi:UDP-glucose:(heptosyl)LPS alpha-1,3-glucosyltransferase
MDVTKARLQILKILYITRTFGPVGGMERYAYEVAREMVQRGHQVSTLCRTVDEAVVAESGVKVIKLHPKPANRGWHDRYVFRDVVNEFLAAPGQRAAYDIIHSHENTIGQHVSTEHGPCTAQGLRLKPWKYFDYSARKNLAIETDKFRNHHLRALVSCSRRVQEIVLGEYPFLAGKITRIITPAYTYLQPVTKDSARPVRVLGFMGRDWKRKGLPKALEIFSHLHREDPRWTMLVAGCPVESLPDRLVTRALTLGRDERSARPLLGHPIQFLGHTDPQDFFNKIDVLVHPALEEPFGMVMSEALTCGVPAVCSNQCGAVDHLCSEGLSVLSVRATDVDWARVCSKVAYQQFPPLDSRIWSEVALEHEQLYFSILVPQTFG